MSDIYVFGKNDDDYTTLGLVGALVPTSATFTEAANGESEVSMEHPIDDFGRYKALVEGNILVVPVPVRTTPEIQNGSIVTTLFTYQIKRESLLTSKNQRTLYKNQTGSKKMKLMNSGETVTVVSMPDGSERWKVKTEYGTGWMLPAGLDEDTRHIIDDNSKSIEEVQSPWKVTDQYFRIYEVVKSLDSISVKARHITYDLLYNLTKYESEEAVTLQTALDGILNNCYSSHEFKAYTNVANENTSLMYKRKNPIEAFMNPEDGICTKFNVNVVRDNTDFYFLHDPGLNRGVRIEYSKNMLGVELTTSNDELATRIIPIGEKKDGSDFFLTDWNSPENPYSNPWIDSPLVNSYAVPHVYELKCEGCKIGEKDTKGGTVTEQVAVARMADQAYQLIEDGCDKPKISMKVEFLNLGDTEEYAQFRDLENCFLFDYVTIIHPKIIQNGITARIVGITWDVIADRMTECEIGNLDDTIANVGITSWQIPSGINGSKISGGTLSGNALQADSITTRHLQADSIEAQHIKADAIESRHIHAQTILAEHIATNALDTIVLNAVSANIQKLIAEEITTEQFYASFASIVEAQVKDLKAEKLKADWADIIKAHIADADIENADIKWADIIKAHIADADIEEADIRWADIIEANIGDATINWADIIGANIGDATINWAAINKLTSNIATIAKEHIAEADIDWANIDNISATMAVIARGQFESAEIKQAMITKLGAVVGNILALSAETADLNFATIQRLIAEAMIIEQGVAGTMTIKNLIATKANFVGATMDNLVLQGEDGLYYRVVIQSDGSIFTQEVQPTPTEIEEQEMSDGRSIVFTDDDISSLNNSNLSAETLMVSDIFTTALTAGKITATEAFIASATIPQLWATSVKAIGDDLDLSANETIRLVVGQMIDDIQPGARNYLRNSFSLGEITIFAKDRMGFSIRQSYHRYYPVYRYSGMFHSGGEDDLA